MGGSAILFGEHMEQGNESEASKSTVASAKEGKSKKDKGKKVKEKETKKSKEGMDDDPGFKMQPSNFLGTVLSGNAEFDGLLSFFKNIFFKVTLIRGVERKKRG